MRFKTLSLMITVVIAFFFLPLTVMEASASLTWDFYEFNAVAQASVVDNTYPGYSDYDFDETFGPPVSITAYAEATNPEDPPYLQRARGFSTLNWNSMYLTSCSFCSGDLAQYAGGYSYAEAYGGFIAEDYIFNFLYSYEYEITARSGSNDANALNQTRAYFQVYDNTDKLFLFDDWIINDIVTSVGIDANSSSGTDADTLSMFIPVGHEIHVSLWTDYFAESNGYSCAGNDRCNNQAHLSFNYDIVLTPEPISSILFLTGGMTLAGRYYWKKRKVKT